MKLEKAIEILEHNVCKSIPQGEIQHLDAVRLGIAALKREGKNRKGTFTVLLPGETEEQDSNPLSATKEML